jgi:flagellar P-ring protein precursor FlgI
VRYLAGVWLALLLCHEAAGAAVRIKDLGRFAGVRDNVAVGYGLVVGLAGSGDSRRNLATVQSVANVLQEFGVQIPATAINSRNVAAVLVTANLPGFVSIGDRLDVNVSSIGDASSLAGGTLLMTPLRGVDRQVYAVAQGALSIGGFRFEQSGTVRQKNHATAGNVPQGAIAERSIAPQLLASDGSLEVVLKDPDFTTATRIAAAINQQQVGAVVAVAIDAGRVRLTPRGGASQEQMVRLIAAVENLEVEPDITARVVVNERTGTIVSGGNVYLSAVTVTQGDLQVSIEQRFAVSQPEGLIRPGAGIQSVVVPEAVVSADEATAQSVRLAQGATIDNLVQALKSIKVSARDIIAILQALKRSGALHAELIIQ